MPTPGTLFRDGDLVYLAVTSAATDRLKKLMGLI
jgi:hypothetical protein